MKTEAFDFSTIHLLHEHLCLDFVNSTPNHQNPSEDHLNTYADFVSWSLDVELLSADAALRLSGVASRQPAETAALHQKVIALREAIYHILLNIIHDQSPKAADLDTLNAALTEAMSHMHLATSGSGFDWAWDYDMDSPAYLVWRVAWSASDLLMSDNVKCIRKCDGCDWLFLDTSRGRRRRWCSMSTCGNRAKARRHYTRSRGE